MLTELNFNKALFTSLLFHLLVFFLLPDLRPHPASIERFMEVELVKPPQIKVKKVSRQITPKPQPKQSVRKSPPRRIVEALPEVGGKLQVSAPPVINMPRRTVANEVPEVDATQLDKRTFEEPAGRPEHVGTDKMAYFSSKREPLEYEALKVGEKRAPLLFGDQAGGSDKEYPLPFVGSTAPTMPQMGMTDYGGTVGRRKILMAGQVPQVQTVSREVTILVRFDVLPDGTVVNVNPQSKGGDAQLEKIAIEIAQRYKFVPLPLDVEQATQWGVLPVTFRQ